MESPTQKYRWLLFPTRSTLKNQISWNSGYGEKKPYYWSGFPTYIKPIRRPIFEVKEIERALYAKIIKKYGNRYYWKDWPNDVTKNFPNLYRSHPEQPGKSFYESVKITWHKYWQCTEQTAHHYRAIWQILSQCLSQHNRSVGNCLHTG